jgi:transposase-like protein
MDTSTSMTVKTSTSGRSPTLRRMRTLEEKQCIVAEATAPGASVAEVARRHGVNANLLFCWCRQDKQGVLGQRTRTPAVKLLPVQLSSEPETLVAEPNLPREPGEGRIEIVLGKDARITIIGPVAAERIEQVLTMLRRS